MKYKNIINGGQLPLDFDSEKREHFLNNDSQRSTNVVNLFTVKSTRETSSSESSVTLRLLREAQQLDW